MWNYKNPVPHLGGKKFMVKIIFDFDDWIEKEDAVKGIEEYLKNNGIPSICVSDVTPIEEYK